MNALARIDRRRPGFLPTSWRPRPGGPGEAFLALLAHFAELVAASVRQAPAKHALALLDTMGVTLLAPTPARAALVFTLADDAPSDVPLPAGTEVAAVAPPPLPASLTGMSATAPPPMEPVLFATDRAVSLARARLAAVFTVVPASDEHADHTPRLADGFELFGGLEQIPHHLYLGHDTLFELPSSASVSLQVGVRGAAATAPRLRWEYATEEGWLAFEPVVDQTRGLAVDGEVLLRKLCGPAAAATTVAGIESYWLRARVVDDPLPLPGTGGEPSTLPWLDRLRARVSFGESRVPLDAAFAGGLRLDTTKDFAPFGLQPEIGSVFVVACDKVFDQEGARVELRFDDSNAGTAAAGTRTIVWEYSAGEGVWETLSSLEEDFSEGAGERGVWFMRPDDWADVSLNGERRRWLRARVVAGNYVSGTPPAVKPPVLAWMSAAYEVQTGPYELDHVLALNHFELVDHTDAARWARAPFQPFTPVPDRASAVYLGFDRPLPLGLVSLLASMPAEVDAAAGSEGSPFTWEYRSEDGWEELAVLDETTGFRRTGTIQFVGQPDLAAAAGPDGPLHWVRARAKAGVAVPEPLPLSGLYHNAVWATHRRSVRGEILGESDGLARLTLRMRHPHVLPGQRIEVQEWSGAGREWESLFAGLHDDDLRYDRDALGLVRGVWVTWHERPHLHSAGAQDRYYTLERSRGLVRFGDRTAGMIPPPGSVVAASYEFGGGPEGNAAAGAIAQLHSAVPYVEAVSNPVAASGGAAGETADRVPSRGRQQLRHRQRAVAPSDYEWIAREASAEVALARCLPATGPGGLQPGHVTLLVAPASAERRPSPSPELLRRVRAHVAARAPAAVAGDVRVLGPEYQPVSVVASVVVSDPSAAAAVEERLRRALDAFLHPLTGGPPGGWTFGDAVHLSHIAGVIEAVEGVDRADELQLTSEGAAFGERVVVPSRRLPAAGRHVLKLRVEA